MTDSTGSFLLLDENRLALTAVRRFAEQSRRPGPLLFLYGVSGVGKSHLASLALREIRESNPQAKYAHVTASEFAAELAQASDSKTIHEFQAHYRSIALFICEDLTGLERRPETQQQFIVVLDELRAAGGKCLFTCRKLPGELDGLSARLVNRCHGGECVGVSMPSRESRVRLLQHFASTRQVPLPAGAVELMADRLPVSPRELLGSVIQLQQLSQMRRQRLSLATVKEYLDAESMPNGVSLAEIARTVAKHFRVTQADLRSAARRQSLTLPRQCAMFLARDLTSESLAEIARFFGRRNHGTVVHACRRMEQTLADSPELRQQLVQIRSALGLAEC